MRAEQDRQAELEVRGLMAGGWWLGEHYMRCSVCCGHLRGLITATCVGLFLQIRELEARKKREQQQAYTAELKAQIDRREIERDLEKEAKHLEGQQMVRRCLL